MHFHCYHPNQAINMSSLKLEGKKSLRVISASTFSLSPMHFFNTEILSQIMTFLCLKKGMLFSLLSVTTRIKSQLPIIDLESTGSASISSPIILSLTCYLPAILVLFLTF